MMIISQLFRHAKQQSLTSIVAGDVYKAAPLIACIVDPRFKECKFFGPENCIQVKAALTCKEKTLLGVHLGEVNELSL